MMAASHCQVCRGALYSISSHRRFARSAHVCIRQGRGFGVVPGPFARKGDHMSEHSSNDLPTRPFSTLPELEETFPGNADFSIAADVLLPERLGRYEVQGGIGN